MRVRRPIYSYNSLLLLLLHHPHEVYHTARNASWFRISPPLSDFRWVTARNDIVIKPQQSWKRHHPALIRLRISGGKLQTAHIAKCALSDVWHAAGLFSSGVQQMNKIFEISLNTKYVLKPVLWQRIRMYTHHSNSSNDRHSTSFLPRQKSIKQDWRSHPLSWSDWCTPSSLP